MLHNAAIRVSWNTSILKEIDEAKSQYILGRKANRHITDEDGKAIDKFLPTLGTIIIQPTPIEMDQLAMRIFDETGDRRIIWNLSDPDQIKEAAALFENYAARGWKAYGIDRHGNKGRRIFGFDPVTQEVLFEEKTTREKLKTFAAKFNEIQVLPRTFPG